MVQTQKMNIPPPFFERQYLSYYQTYPLDVFNGHTSYRQGGHGVLDLLWPSFYFMQNLEHLVERKLHKVSGFLS